MELSQMLRRAVQVNGCGIATIEGGNRRTWAEEGDRVARLAAGLAAQGVSEGDRVAILAGNCVHYWEALFALFQLGAVAVPLNTRLTRAELAYQLDDAGAIMLLAGAGFGDMAQALRCTTLRTLIGLEDQQLDATIENLIASSEPRTAFVMGDDRLAGIYYTGGTTGLPKGVMLSHRNLVAMASNLIMHLKVDCRSVVLHSAPMFHLADFAIFVATMVAGTHVVIPRFDDETMLKAIADARVTHSFTVPLMIDRIARHPRLTEFDISSLQVLGYGGAPMPRGTYEHARATLPQIEFCQGFGMTEMPAHTFLDMEAHRDPSDSPRLRSAGQAGYLYEVRICDAEGRTLPPGEFGEIAGRGDNVMMGYWNKPDESAAVLHDGWMFTGDAGFMDEQGNVTITDRFKDMIVTGGENVWTIEVENVVSRYPGVLECAVIGLPDERWGERVHAILGLAPDADFDAAAFDVYCRDRLAGYKRPRSVEVVREPLPRSGAGKILKRDLRATRQNVN
ncbi:acyl-CoA synthetase (AMP-forming)/AMP-acid ligase II [Novosphingobium kunmingense]|uniref:Acyl-CoA synthetase (AMP-forming)/AMP-acid ligase II n=1 Tax=Novosphingobium kunmingense TaxID=1211806 RepID=A0A2N0H389_9SPHN|nr:AMP-binding protein [Novosphingobium kunmingense]PKB13412.1 acyl-CoA synthetase (AMP-forming)/AMP-acid ligase II [Novosphingobium kunmingense]